MIITDLSTSFLLSLSPPNCFTSASYEEFILSPTSPLPFCWTWSCKISSPSITSLPPWSKIETIHHTYRSFYDWLGFLFDRHCRVQRFQHANTSSTYLIDHTSILRDGYRWGVDRCTVTVWDGLEQPKPLHHGPLMVTSPSTYLCYIRRKVEMLFYQIWIYTYHDDTWMYTFKRYVFHRFMLFISFFCNDDFFLIFEKIYLTNGLIGIPIDVYYRLKQIDIISREGN